MVEKFFGKEIDFPSAFCYILSKYNSFSSLDEKKTSLPKLEIGQTDYSTPQALGSFTQKESCEKRLSMKRKKILAFFFASSLILVASACVSKPQMSVILNDFHNPSQILKEVTAKEGKGDYYLLRDEGYSLRIIYLCANRIYNFVDDPDKNPILVSLQPLLDSQVEKKLSPEDRKRVWACREQRVREEQFQVEERKKRLIEERKKLAQELSAAFKERNNIIDELEFKEKLFQQRKRQLELEEERRRVEEERHQRQLVKAEEEQRRKIEEERKIRAYKAGEKEKEVLSPLPPSIPERGIFLVMKDASVHEAAKNNSRIEGQVRKYDLFEVFKSQRDEHKMTWYQVLLSERFISKREKKVGWSPEEKSFWAKNKLLAWVYPGDLSKINTTKPLKLNVEEIQFTGIKLALPKKNPFYEVIYEITDEYIEKSMGWVKEQDGIRRPDKHMDEMMDLLNKLAHTLWPIKIQNDILRGFIRTGFTSEQIVLSWGPPDHVNTTRTFLGTHEQWVYGEKPFPKAYVYFEDGAVKSWEFLKR